MQILIQSIIYSNICFCFYSHMTYVIPELNIKTMKASVLFRKLDLFKVKCSKPLPYTVFSELEFQHNFDQLTNKHSLGSSAWLGAIFRSRYSRNLLFKNSENGFDSLLFISKVHQDFFTMMYRDLIDSGKDISQRIDRFVFHVDEVWEDIRKKENEKLPKSHGIDLSLVSLLLSVTDPSQYLYFERDVFQNYLRVMESPIIHQYDDYERYCKVMRNTFKQMKIRLDVELVMDMQLKKSVHYNEDSIAWAGIFARFVVGNLD